MCLVSQQRWVKRPGGERQILEPFEPRPQRCVMSEEGVTVRTLIDTHMLYMWAFKDAAGQTCLLPGCYHWTERQKQTLIDGVQTG